MDVRLLGPVEASVDGRAVAVGAGKPRALLALLALHAGSTVSSERLIEGLWGEQPPATAVKLVQLHVSQLRKAFGAAGDGRQILTRGHGYELRLGPDDLDVTRFERLVAGRQAARGARPVARPAARRRRRRAVRGRRDPPAGGAAARRPSSWRSSSTSPRAGTARSSASSSGSCSRSRCARRCTAQRMLALYRSGRQADALEAYRQARTALVERMGVEPGPELRRLHEAILRQDESLEAVRPARRRRREPARGRAPGAAPVEDDLVERRRRAAGARGSARTPTSSSARSRAWPRSTSTTPASSSAASGSSPSWSRGSTGAPLTGIVGPSGSGKSSALRAGLLAGARGRRAARQRALADRRCCAPASTRCARSRRPPRRSPPTAGSSSPSISSRSSSRPAATRTSARRSPTRSSRARDPRRRALVLVAIRADFYGRCAAVPGAGAAARRQPRARRADAPRRAAPRDRAARRSAPAWRSSPSSSTRCSRTSRAARRAAAAVDRAARALAAPRRAPPAPGRLRARRRRATARWRGSPSARTSGSTPEQRPVARRILLRLAGEGEACAGASRCDELDGDGRSRCSPPTAWSRSARARSRSRTRRCCASGRGCAGWLEEDAQGRRLHRAPARGRARVGGGGRDPGELYRGARLAAVLDWSAATTPSSTRPSATSWPRAARRASARSAGCGRSVAGLAALLVAGGRRRRRRARPARQRPRRGDRGGGPAPRRARARRGRPRPLAAARPPGRRARRLAADAREPAGGAAQEPGRDRRAARRRRPPDRARPQPGRAHAGVRRQRRHAELRRPAHAARGGTAGRRVPGLVGIIDEIRRDDLRFSPDGSRLAVGGDEPVVLDARTRRVLARLPLGPDRFVYALRFSPDGRTLFAAVAIPERVTTTIQRFDARTGEPVGSRPVGEPRPRDADAHGRRPARGDDRRRARTRRSTTPARCARCGAGRCARNRRP